VNIFFVGLTGSIGRIPILLSKQLNFSSIHQIILSDADLHPNCSSYNYYRDASLGKFYQEEEYADIAIDAKILKDLASCESEALKMMDRFQNTNGLLFYEKRINLYHKQVRYWLNYLKKNKIDTCVFGTIPHVVHDYIIFSLCKYLGIKTSMFYRFPILPNRNVSLYSMTDWITQDPEICEKYNFHLKNPEALKLKKNFLGYLDLQSGNKGKTFTGIMRSNKGLSKLFKISNYNKFIKYKIDHWSTTFQRRSDLKNNLLTRAHPRFFSKKRISYLQAPNLDEKFIYASLHFQPECSTSPMGGQYVHQDLMIEALIKNIPADYKIYIKPHIYGGLAQSLSRRIKFDHRTFLVAPSLNSYEFIKNSSAVATVTGTAGWEAFLNKKPVLMFGENFYKAAPGVFSIQSSEDFILSNKKIFDENFKIETDMIHAFLKSMQEISFEGWVDNRYENYSPLSPEDNANNIAARLLKILNNKEL